MVRLQRTLQPEVPPTRGLFHRAICQDTPILERRLMQALTLGTYDRHDRIQLHYVVLAWVGLSHRIQALLRLALSLG